MLVRFAESQGASVEALRDAVGRDDRPQIAAHAHAIAGAAGNLGADALRVAAKALEGAPHEVLLVLDANTGQNSLTQVKAFDEALGLTGLILTKLDGTAKGGVVCAIAKERPVPLLFVGVGEDIEDLRPFVARDFAEALVG